MFLIDFVSDFVVALFSPFIAAFKALFSNYFSVLVLGLCFVSLFLISFLRYIKPLGK